MPPLPATLLLACLTTLATLTSLAHARLPPRHVVTLDVVADHDPAPLPHHHHQGHTWIAGALGQPYRLRLHNTSAARVMVVLSVDGLNVITGQPASPDQDGYVLAPGQWTEITGWRKSLDTVARFVFTDPGDSYAARTGQPANIGVIGMAVFQERTPHPITAPRVTATRRARPTVNAAPAPAASASHHHEAVDATDAISARATHAGQSADRQRLGTGHGDLASSRVSTTRFVRASATPVQRTQLRYDSAQRLAAMGIALSPSGTTVHPTAPNPFPGRFAPDPFW